uniref:Poly [ADP-ribose] polymerase n=1 Tax=Calidris pygmaea TaxID=425635 RepID=A0A8C3PM25_9CHAR
MEKVIPAKSLVAVQFVEKEKSSLYLELRKKGVTVCFDTKTPCISLSGSRAEVPKAVATFEKILSSLYLKSVPVNTPGAKEFFAEREDSCVFEAKQKFSCLIRLEEEQQQQMDEKVVNKEKRKLRYKKVLPDGVVVAVYKADLNIFVAILLQTDVVVNSVGTDLNFGTGPLCKALLAKAGPELEAEFDKAIDRNNVLPDEGSVLCTTGCALACKYVLHAIVPLWDGLQGQTLKILEGIINSCLKKTEELGLNSIAFPAIGTGGFGFPKTLVSELMFDMVFKFSSNHTRKTLKEVHFILSPRDLDNIQVILLGNKAAYVTYCSSYSLTIYFSYIIGSITLQVISGDITKEDTEVIVNITNSTFNTTTGVFKAIMDAAGSEVEEEYALSLSQNGMVITQGGKLSCKKIMHLISSNNVKSQVSLVLEKCEQRKYKSVSFPAIGTGQAGQCPAKVADEMLDAIVEFATKASVQHLKKIKIVIFQANMLRDFYESMKKREGSNSSITELPAQWEDMRDERVKLVNLKPSSREYVEVQNRFKKTCPNFVIEKIERIQNPFLWQTYQIKKKSLCKKNKYQSNEKLLFHGTAASSLSTINYNGFNRGFAGKNAAVIGNGTYFAVDASYSAQSTYSRPDMNGRRYMYLARVLAGQYCTGSKGLITPPPKDPADPTDLYDSVVDDVDSPRMFVIFNDIQAYPEYLITFRK